QRRARRGRSTAGPRWACMAADQCRASPPGTQHMRGPRRDRAARTRPKRLNRIYQNGGRDDGGDIMKATRILHDLGQSLWLDNITRNLWNSGVLRRYIDELSVTGLTSNPTIFDHAIKNSRDYDDAIKRKLAEGKSGEKLFFELALDDLTQAADLFRPIYD